MMRKISIWLSKLSLWISGFGLMMMTAVITWQVFARYVLNAAPAWTEQASLLLMLWFILFAAAAGIREGFHIRLSLAQEILGPRVGVVLRLISHVVVLVVAVLMTKEGVALAWATTDHTIPTLGISRTFAFWPFAISGFVTAIFAVEHIHGEIVGRKIEPLWK